MLSVPGIGPGKEDCAIARVRAAVDGAHGPMMVHRLDTDTSGLMVIATDPDAQRAISMQFEARTVAKAYLALVEGEPAGEGVIELPMRPDPRNRPYQIVDFFDGRPATTRYRVLGPVAGATLVRFEPHTGRTHQIRLHAAHPNGLGSPIVNDILYNPRPSAGRLMLHAAELAFDDPRTGERIRVSCPADFAPDHPPAQQSTPPRGDS